MRTRESQLNKTWESIMYRDAMDGAVVALGFNAAHYKSLQ